MPLPQALDGEENAVDFSSMTDEDRLAFEQAEEAAFDQAFDKPNGHEAPPSSAASPAAATGAPAPAPAAPAPAATKADDEDGDPPAPAPAAAPAAPTPAPPPDPMAGLPESVRTALAQMPTLVQDLGALKGRFSRAQRELDELRRFKESATAAPPPATPNLDRVRKELPEVADALDEWAASKGLKSASAAPQPAAADDDQPTEEQLALAEAHPDWGIIAKPEFNIWIDGKGADFARKVRGSSNVAFISSTLTEFKLEQRLAATAATERQRQAAAAAAERSNRVAAAAARPGGGGRPPATPAAMDEEAAFQAGFSGNTVPG